MKTASPGCPSWQNSAPISSSAIRTGSSSSATGRCRPAVVDSPYVIRAAVALTMVAAAIPGRSVVRNAEIIKRAHPRFVENLRSLGAELEWK